MCTCGQAERTHDAARKCLAHPQAFEAAQHMIGGDNTGETRGGKDKRIVFVSSRGARRGEPKAMAYGASKAALNSLTGSLAQVRQVRSEVCACVHVVCSRLIWSVCASVAVSLQLARRAFAQENGASTRMPRPRCVGACEHTRAWARYRRESAHVCSAAEGLSGVRLVYGEGEGGGRRQH